MLVIVAALVLFVGGKNILVYLFNTAIKGKNSSGN